MARSGLCEWIRSGWGKRLGEFAFGGGLKALGADDRFRARGYTSLVLVFGGVKVVPSSAVTEWTCAPNIKSAASENALEVIDTKSIVLI